jgi:hypothetical protein
MRKMKQAVNFVLYVVLTFQVFCENVICCVANTLSSPTVDKIFVIHLHVSRSENYHNTK